MCFVGEIDELDAQTNTVVSNRWRRTQVLQGCCQACDGQLATCNGQHATYNRRRTVSNGWCRAQLCMHACTHTLG